MVTDDELSRHDSFWSVSRRLRPHASDYRVLSPLAVLTTATVALLQSTVPESEDRPRLFMILIAGRCWDLYNREHSI